jgi:hypothetical protein
MIWFKTKREKELEELCGMYKKQLEDLNKAVPNFASSFVCVGVPTPEDMKAYHTKIAALTTDPLYLFYLVQLRRSVVDEFEILGKDSPEYYRGKLALIGMLFQDAAKASKQLGVPQNGL